MDEMTFKDIFSPGGHFVRLYKTIYAILVEGNLSRG